MPHASKKPIFCFVTDRKALGAGDATQRVLDRVRMAASAGADWIQIREKDLPARELLPLAREAVDLASGPGNGNARILVNDRLDVALAAGSAGVHLGRESIPLPDVVRWCRSGNAPQGFLIGLSCHGLAEVREAQNAGASYVFFGPIFDTPSKKSFGPPQGIAKLSEVCWAVQIPVIAIGGVNEQNSMECLRAGAAGIAAIRFFQEASDTGTLESAMARIGGPAKSERA